MKKRQMKTMYQTLLVSALVVGVSTSYAQGMLFSEMDTDKSGSVSEQEFNTAKAKRIETRALEGRQMRGLSNSPAFADIDVDKDGQLTAEEITTVQQARMQARMDSGMGQGRGMGKGSGMQRNQPSFTDFDANSDNYITKQEFYDARNKRIAERAKQGYAMRGLAKAPSFENVDSNNDGKVSQDEFMVQQNKHMQSRPGQK